MGLIPDSITFCDLVTITQCPLGAIESYLVSDMVLLPEGKWCV